MRMLLFALMLLVLLVAAVIGAIFVPLAALLAPRDSPAWPYCGALTFP